MIDFCKEVKKMYNSKYVHANCIDGRTSGSHRTWKTWKMKVVMEKSWNLKICQVMEKSWNLKICLASRDVLVHKPLPMMTP